MLRALGAQLSLMAADTKNHYTSIVRRLAGPREAVHYEQPLRRLILAMPDMIAQLRNWTDESGLPMRVRRLQSYALDYLYNPKDFLSVHSPGLFEYLDDAYLVVRVYQLSLADEGCSRLQFRIEGKSLAKSVPEWIELTRRLLPKETSQIDELLDDVARGRNGRIQRALTKPAKRN